VVKGDTLDRIAGKYATTVPALAEANNIPNPNLIIIGQQLLIPSGNQAKSTSSPAKGASADTISGRSGKKHIVKPGDTLESIAAQYDGVTADQIAKANGIVDGDVHTGQALYLGGPGYVATGTKGETTYQVRPGDRLSDIASSHGISTAKLASLNGVSDPNLIRAGQVLTVPTGNAWVCPVEGASFMNDWGFPRDHGARYHEGTDLFADRGAEVLAPVSGTVTQKSGTIGGLQFSLDGSDGVRYIGSHMSKYGKAGKVNAGDVIGYVGATGNAFGTPPHLHFGIYYKGTPVNPFPTLLAHGCK
jgi:murein DD-endopeptidase MepM/ murein hydrolase activator NlpD